VDPIHPIAPGPSPIAAPSRLPVDPLQPITRERDRPANDGQRRRRRESAPPPEPQGTEGDEGGEHPHIDIRA
jgi:hypothetical protein